MKAKLNTAVVSVVLTMSHEEAQVLATLLSLTAIPRDADMVGTVLTKMANALEDASVPYKTLSSGTRDAEAIEEAIKPFCGLPMAAFDELEDA